MQMRQIIAQLRRSGSQNVPFTGAALGNLSRTPSYQAAANGTLGVPTFWVGGKLRTSSIAIAERLGLDDLARELQGAAKDADQVAEPLKTPAPHRQTIGKATSPPRQHAASGRPKARPRSLPATEPGPERPPPQPVGRAAPRARELANSS